MISLSETALKISFLFKNNKLSHPGLKDNLNILEIYQIIKKQ
jgi:hypothetical protein